MKRKLKLPVKRDIFKEMQELNKTITYLEHELNKFKQLINEDFCLNIGQKVIRETSNGLAYSDYNQKSVFYYNNKENKNFHSQVAKQTLEFMITLCEKEKERLEKEWEEKYNK